MGFVDSSALRQVGPKPGWHGRFFHSEHMTFAYYEIEGGAALNAHSHPQEEVWHIIEGEAAVTLSDETRLVRAGGAVVIPSGIPHAVVVKKGCRAIVVDYPVRGEVAGMKI